MKYTTINFYEGILVTNLYFLYKTLIQQDLLVETLFLIVIFIFNFDSFEMLPSEFVKKH